MVKGQIVARNRRCAGMEVSEAPENAFPMVQLVLQIRQSTMNGGGMWVASVSTSMATWPDPGAGHLFSAVPFHSPQKAISTTVPTR